MKNKYACPCCGQGGLIPTLLEAVEKLKKQVGQPFTITSGFRCQKHNAKIGSKPTSSHTKGMAVDIACDNSRLRFLIIREALKLGFCRIGIGFQKGFIHLDIDGGKDPDVLWGYKDKEPQNCKYANLFALAELRLEKIQKDIALIKLKLDKIDEALARLCPANTSEERIRKK